MVAPIGYGPLEKPHSPKSASGDLSPEWLIVAEEDVIMPVHMGKGQVISATSWADLVSRVRVGSMAAGVAAVDQGEKRKKQGKSRGGRKRR